MAVHVYLLCSFIISFSVVSLFFPLSVSFSPSCCFFITTMETNFCLEPDLYVFKRWNNYVALLSVALFLLLSVKL